MDLCAALDEDVRHGVHRCPRDPCAPALGTCGLVTSRRGRATEAASEMRYDEFAALADIAAEAGLSLQTLPTVRRSRIALPDGRYLSALLWGDSEPKLMLIHGGGQNAHTWDTVLLALGEPAVAVDLPGHGHSDSTHPTLSPIDGYAADITAVVRALTPTPAAVVGMSAGGLGAIAAAAHAPDTVERLMLVDILPDFDAAPLRSTTELLDGPSTFASLDAMVSYVHRVRPARSLTQLRRRILHNAVQRRDGSWQWRHNRPRASLRPASPEQAQLLADRLWADLASLQVRIQLVRGGRRGSVVTDEAMARLRSLHPDSVITTVPGAGHSIQGHQPLQLAKLIKTFLA